MFSKFRFLVNPWKVFSCISVLLCLGWSLFNHGLKDHCCPACLLAVSWKTYKKQSKPKFPFSCSWSNAWGFWNSEQVAIIWVQIYHSILWFLLSSFHSLERELPLLKNMTNGISLHILIDMAKFVLKWCYDMPSQWWKNVFQIHGFSFQRWEYAYFCQHLIHCTSQGLNEQKLSFLSWKWYLQSSQSLWGTT